MNGNIDIEDCGDPNQLRIGQRYNTTWDEPDYSYPSSIQSYPYNEWGTHPMGPQDFRVDFEFEFDAVNVRYIVLKHKLEAKYHEIDLDMTVVTTLVEVT
jgi:hypothetical protein